MRKIVAIHQPNFFPWLGYFNKISKSSHFIFLDDVQYPKKGGTWSNRVRLLVGEKARWVTADLDRQYHGTRTINEMSFLSDSRWRQKVINTIDASYGRHPFYDEVMPLVSKLVLNGENNIAEYNIAAVEAISLRLGINMDGVSRSSEFSIVASSNELLCELTLRVGGNGYMCGGGSDGYQDEAVYRTYGVDLVHQNYSHPEYPQARREEFVPGLSVIDAAMNVGWDGVSRLIESD